MCREYTYFWPTFNGALVAEMSPNPVFWYLFFKFSWGACPQTPLALACFACWVYFAHLHHQKGPLFLEKNLPTLSSAYGPVVEILFNTINYEEAYRTACTFYISTYVVHTYFIDVVIVCTLWYITLLDPIST